MYCYIYIIVGPTMYFFVYKIVNIIIITNIIHIVITAIVTKMKITIIILPCNYIVTNIKYFFLSVLCDFSVLFAICWQIKYLYQSHKVSYNKQKRDKFELFGKQRRVNLIQIKRI